MTEKKSTPSDPTPKPRKKPGPKKGSRKAKPVTTTVAQTHAAVLIARGVSIGKTAEIVGVHRSSIESWNRTEFFRGLLERETKKVADKLRGPVDEAIDDLKRNAPMMARRLVDIGLTAKGDDLHTAVRALTSALDRAGIGAKVKHDVAMTVDLSGTTDEALWARLEELRRAREEAGDDGADDQHGDGEG